MQWLGCILGILRKTMEDNKNWEIRILQFAQFVRNTENVKRLLRKV